MSKSIFEIRGIDELRAKIKALPDKVKKKEIIKILRQSAKSTVAQGRLEAPKSKKPHSLKGGKLIMPGNLMKSIKVKVMTKARQPMIVVGPRSRGKYDGFYGRQFVIPGHGKTPPNPFMERAKNKTEGRVSADAVAKTEKYIQKQIDRL